MPAYKLQGIGALYFAGWKAHYSLYPVSERMAAEFKAEFAPYTVDKATIRFPFRVAVPVALIERIAVFRATKVGAQNRRRN